MLIRRRRRPGPAGVSMMAIGICAIASAAASQNAPAQPRTPVGLERLNQWYALRAPEDNPITPKQLEAAVLDTRSIGRIQALFEAAIARGLRLDGRWITPEAGGEAVLDDQLRLVEAADGRWATVRELASVAANPVAVARLVEARPDAVAAVDTHGLLKVAVARFRLGSRNAGSELVRAILTLALNTATSYEHDPQAQLALITSRDWRGRYVGRWHLHPPHDVGAGWAAGAEPSYEDMQNAVASGQYLTLAFHPEGFDLYDASALGDLGRVDLSALKVIRYRSSQWHARFSRLHRKTMGARSAAHRPS